MKSPKLWGKDREGNQGFVFSHVKTIYYNWASKILLKTKLDEMDALIDAKIAKAMMSSQQINDANKVPTSALAYTMGQSITQNATNIAKLNSDLEGIKTLPTQHRLDNSIGDIAKDYNVPNYVTYITTNQPVTDPDKNYIFGGNSYTIIGMEYNNHRYGYQLGFSGISTKQIKIRYIQDGIWDGWKSIITEKISLDFFPLICLLPLYDEDVYLEHSFTCVQLNLVSSYVDSEYLL